MAKGTARLRLITCLILVVASASAIPGASAESGTSPERPVPLSDALITDAQEAHELPELPGDPLAPGEGDAPTAPTAASPTCSRDGVLTGPNATPSSPSFQYVYFLPSDTTAAETMDRPRSCSDGSVLASALGNSSRNLTVWQEARGADLNYRVIKHTYNHNYGGTYTTRAIRRFRSDHSAAWWNGQELPARLDAMRDELVDNSWNKSDTKYIVMLHAGARPYSCGTMKTCYNIGRAYTGGAYAFSTRYLPAAGNNPYMAIRYGCDTTGDIHLGHEATHLLGAQHVSDTKFDLMFGFLYHDRTMGSSDPPMYWDYNRNNYHNTVRNSSYVIAGGLSGSVTTC